MKWNLIKLGAIAKENDPLNRKIGEPLWKERYPIEKLEEIKQFMGSKNFSGLFQQEPSEEDNNFFFLKGLVYFNNEENEVINDYPIKDNFVFLSVDPACSAGNNSDYTVIAVCGKNMNDDLFIYEVLKKRILAGSHAKEIIRLARKYNTWYVIIESNGFQKTIEEELISMNFVTYGFKSKESKQDRAAVLSSKINKGKVFLKARANWLDDLITELEEFPDGKHDDQVDALTFACLHSPISKNSKVIGMKNIKPSPMKLY